MKKQNLINKYKKFYERRVLWSEEDNVFIVRFPELPGCQTDGKDRIEALENADEALDGFLEALENLGRPIPVPVALVSDEVKAFQLRMNSGLFGMTSTVAKTQGMSVNEFVNRTVADKLGMEYTPPSQKKRA